MGYDRVIWDIIGLHGVLQGYMGLYTASLGLGPHPVVVL